MSGYTTMTTMGKAHSNDMRRNRRTIKTRKPASQAVTDKSPECTTPNATKLLGWTSKQRFTGCRAQWQVDTSRQMQFGSPPEKARHADATSFYFNWGM